MMKVQDVDGIGFLNQKKERSFQRYIGIAAVTSIVTGYCIVKACNDYVKGREDFDPSNKELVRELYESALKNN